MGIIHIAGASVWGGGEQYVYDINAEMSFAVVLPKRRK